MKSICFFLFTCFTWTISSQTLYVLGTLQDGGSPHMGCEKLCCSEPKPQDFVSSLGVVGNEKSFIFDATPDVVSQTNFLKSQATENTLEVFLTHAHMGHYTGLMHLGREASNAQATAVYVMPKMRLFLEQNGPWSQLVTLKNITLKPLVANQSVVLEKYLKVTPIKVPHRDEYSETVGFIIQGKNKKALYIPDIDKWSKWSVAIYELIKTVDYAFLDGTFYADGELPRPMSEVPHPFVKETVELLKSLPFEDREKVYFIHLNHTNPARNPDFQGRLENEKLGFHFAKFGQSFEL